MDSNQEYILDRVKTCNEILKKNKISITEEVVFAYDGLYLSIHPLWDKYNLLTLRLFQDNCKFIELTYEEYIELFDIFEEILLSERNMEPYNLQRRVCRGRIFARKISTDTYIIWFPKGMGYFKKMFFRISQIEQFDKEKEEIKATVYHIGSELDNLMSERFSSG